MPDQDDFPEVIEDHEFAEALAKLIPDAKRRDEVIDGPKWRISRDAHNCAEVPGTILRVTFSEEGYGAPALRIFFTIDNRSQRTLRHVEIYDQADL